MSAGGGASAAGGARIGVERGGVRFLAAVVAAFLFAGCAPAPPLPPLALEPTSAAPVAPAPPAPAAAVSLRGNPPFYDVLGKRYFVLASSDGFRQRGIASWYGRDFHGLSTSSGEKYDMNGMTAAHPTLPIPTWVEVTNLGNGKQVVVKVNDRGPFVGDRIIDLSYAAAVALDMIGPGTAQVEIRAVDTQAATIRTASTAAPVAGAAAAPAVASTAAVSVRTALAPQSPQERMYVQAGAFADGANARRLAAELTADGLANSIVVAEGDGRRALHRVRVGPVRNAAEYDRISARLRALGIANPHLVIDR